MLLTESVWGCLVVTAAVSMVPVLELRGAIPLGLSLGLKPWMCYGAAVLGNMIPVPFILLFLRGLFRWLRKFPRFDRLIAKIEEHGRSKGDVVLKYRFWGLLILVAVPLPGTGAWTGSLVAALLELRLKRALPAIFLGVLVAGAIVTAASLGVLALR